MIFVIDVGLLENIDLPPFNCSYKTIEREEAISILSDKMEAKFLIYHSRYTARIQRELPPLNKAISGTPRSLGLLMEGDKVLAFAESFAFADFLVSETDRADRRKFRYTLIEILSPPSAADRELPIVSIEIEFENVRREI